MVATVGKKLQQARQQKSLSIEEVARATKVHADRLADLEHDDFTHFPNLTYAKSFLLIYAKYLGVDVSEFASSFENTSQISLSNYDYLANASEPSKEIVHHHVPAPSSSSKPLTPILALVALIVLGGAAIKYLSVMAKRLTPVTKTESVTAATPTPVPAPAATPVPAIPPHIAQSDENALRSAPPPTTPRPNTESPITQVQSGATPRFAGELEIRRPLPVNASDLHPVATPLHPVATPAPAPVKTTELVIQPIRKTWVLIQRDDDHSPPVFEDWIYPDAPPLKVRGNKFWIEIKDPGAVKVSKNGQPVRVESNKVIID